MSYIPHYVAAQLNEVAGTRRVGNVQGLSGPKGTVLSVLRADWLEMSGDPAVEMTGEQHIRVSSLSLESQSVNFKRRRRGAFANYARLRPRYSEE